MKRTAQFLGASFGLLLGSSLAFAQVSSGNGGMGAGSGNGGISSGFSTSGAASGGGFGAGSGGGTGPVSFGSGSLQSPFIPRPTITGTGFGLPNYTPAAGLSPMNPFSPYYMNPLAGGLPGGTRQQGTNNFGQPLYGTTGLTGTAGTFPGGGVGGGRTTAGGGSFPGGGVAGVGSRPTGSFTPYGSSQFSPYFSRVPVYAYTTVPAFEFRPAPASRLQLEAQQVLARSTSLNRGGDIQVLTDGATVVLRGIVADERERRLAEGLIRLTPGVREVRNELGVRVSAR